MEQYRALIIGAGSIGACYDNPDSSEVLTHAHAYVDSGAFELTGFVDCRMEAAERSAEIWGGNAYTDLAEAFRIEKPEVVSICVPDHFHAPVLKQVWELGPRMVFTEKPLAVNSTEARWIARLYEEKRIPLAVNYSRRFLPKLKCLADKIHSDSYGLFINGIGWYGKGLLHNGSHMIDLLHQLIGPVSSSIQTDSLTDWSEKDPSISASLRMSKGGAVFLQAVDSRVITLFELDMIFERARLRLIDSCATLEEYQVEEHERYRGYPVFRFFRSETTDLTEALPRAIDNLRAHLETGMPLSCSAMDACDVIEDCERIRSDETIHFKKQTVVEQRMNP